MTFVAIQPNQAISFYYTNYRGERALREVTFVQLEYGTNEYYPEVTFFLRARDRHRGGAERSFDVGNIEDLRHGWREEWRDESVMPGPGFGQSPIQNPAMDSAREQVAAETARSSNAIIAEAVLRATGKDIALIDIPRQMRSLRAVNSDEQTIYLDGEEILVLKDPQYETETDPEGMSVKIHIDHRFVGKAAR